LISEIVLREYLLGRLSDAEAQEIEEKLLGDEELFMTLRSIEDDLIDDSVMLSRANGEESTAILRRIPQSRVRFARALARRTSNVVPFARRRWIVVALTAAATVAIIAGALLMRREQHVSQPIIAHAVRSAVPYTVAISLATSRSASTTQTITIPPNATTLRLRVQLDPADRFARYRAELQSNRGVVWHAENLEPAAEKNALIVSADVPASVVANGSYELAVRGDNEDLGVVTLEVHR
jgi:hypothetical protein